MNRISGSRLEQEARRPAAGRRLLAGKKMPKSFGEGLTSNIIIAMFGKFFVNCIHPHPTKAAASRPTTRPRCPGTLAGRRVAANKKGVARDLDHLYQKTIESLSILHKNQNLLPPSLNTQNSKPETTTTYAKINKIHAGLDIISWDTTNPFPESKATTSGNRSKRSTQSRKD